jgi:hypothetical protein
VPIIALTARAGPENPRALVEIEVATPGIDHDAIDFSPLTGGLGFRAATAPNETPSVAQVLNRIYAGISEAARVSP